MEFPNYELKALTNIWTGDVEGKESKLRLTGIKGSIRWWYEALVRGLGGYACDPTSSDKCELVKDKLSTFQNKYKELMRQRDEGKDPIKGPLDEAGICPACQLFGCTGWGAKVRLNILSIAKKNKDGDPITNQIKANDEFILKFISLKPLTDDEKNLLNATIKLIVEYSAIGGKTVLKPSEQNNNSHHKDYGLICSIKPIAVKKIPPNVFTSAACRTCQVFAWASLKNMWFVGEKYLARQNNGYSAFNKIIGRPEKKTESQNGDSWVAGSKGVSKKVFSFKSHPRTFGFVDGNNEKSFDDIKAALETVWGANGWSFITGAEIITKFFSVDRG